MNESHRPSMSQTGTGAHPIQSQGPHAPHPPNAPHAPHAPQGTPQRMAPHPPPVRPGVVPAPPAKSVVPAQTQPPSDKDLEPISLVEDLTEAAPVAQSAPKKIMAFGADAHHRKQDWKRQTNKDGTGATRIRSFHGKYSEQGLEYLDNAINEWLDNNPDVEVKFCTSTVMTFEGKIREPALVLNLWY
jgi:hypothetical protein